MIVVSNTSPLNYLILIETIDVLPAVYGAILVSPVVLRELGDPGSPDRVRSWASVPPDWLVQESPQMTASPQAVNSLDEGEAQAITLALQKSADRLLIDERADTYVARDLGLRTIGVLGILDLAARQELVDLPFKLSQLESETNFRMTPKLRAHLLERDHLRRQARGARPPDQPKPHN